MLTPTGYKLLQPLDVGCNCRVFLVQSTTNGHKYALKLPNPHNQDQNKFVIKRESEILKMLDHPHLVKLIECGTSATSTESGLPPNRADYSVLELVPNGELFHYLDLTGKFSEELARFYFKQLIETLDYCHRNGVAHRDVKPSNLMLDEHFNMKLIDFGFAGSSSSISNDVIGTTEFMAPELNYSQPYIGAGVDVFSVGVTLFCMVAGKIPFRQACHQNLTYRMIEQGLYEDFWDFHSQTHGIILSNDLKSLIISMLQSDPSKRPTLATIKYHPWYIQPAITHPEVLANMLQRKLMLANAIKKRQQAQACASIPVNRPSVIQQQASVQNPGVLEDTCLIMPSPAKKNRQPKAKKIVIPSQV